MSYLGSSLTGNTAPSGALLDLGLSAKARLVHQTVLKDTYQRLIAASPAAVEATLISLQQQVEALPPDQKQLYYEIQARFANADPREAPGLGVYGLEAVGTAVQIAATLATVFLAVRQMKFDDKAKKDAANLQAIQQREYAAQTAEIQKQNQAQQAQQQSTASKTPYVLGAAAIGTAFLLTR